jgi:hypothetical protein
MPPTVDRKRKKPREFILWVEGFGFSLIIVFAWLTEILQLPHLFFAEPAASNWSRALLRTCVVLGVWLAVHIYTRRLLQRLHQLEEFLRICSWCRKIEHDGQWVTMEEFFGSELATKMTHGICPQCTPALEKTDRREKK